MIRELLAIAIIMLLIGFGWKQPFERHVRHIMGEPVEPPPSAVTVGQKGNPRATVPPIRKEDSAWMWRETAMEKPYQQSNGHAR